jgi:hypothetical protein
LDEEIIVPIDLMPIALVAAVLLLLAFGLSFYLPSRFFRGAPRRVTLALVAAAWACLLFAPPAARKWRASAVAACELDRKSLPDEVYAEGFLDEGGALRKKMVAQLFSERGLSFIEIKVHDLAGKGPMIAYPDGDQESGWMLPGAREPWVRLELSDDHDPNCTRLPFGLDERIGMPPFLPDTCISLRYLPTPSARIALTLLPPATKWWPLAHGKWGLVDRLEGRTLGALTTSNPTPWVASGRELSAPGRLAMADCRSPHTMLVDRIRNRGKSGVQAGPQLLQVEKVQALPDGPAVETLAHGKLPVQATAEIAAWTEAENRLLFSRDIRKQEWKATVDIARERGLAAFGARLLDWPARKLIALEPVQDPAKNWRWSTFAVGNGFFVAAGQHDWKAFGNNLLIRYRRDGGMHWFMRVAAPKAGSRCREFSPRAIYSTERHLILASRCGQKPSTDEALRTGKTVGGELWLVPLASLPGPL